MELCSIGACHVLTWTFLISCWQAIASVRALVRAVLSWMVSVCSKCTCNCACLKLPIYAQAIQPNLIVH